MIIFLTVLLGVTIIAPFVPVLWAMWCELVEDIDNEFYPGLNNDRWNF